MEVTSRYEALPVNARLVAALRVSEQILQTWSCLTDGVVAWLDHMWAWLTVDEHSFDAWNDWSNPVLEFALGGEAPEDLLDRAASSGVKVAEVRTPIEAVAELVYGHLFAAVAHGRNLEQLQRVADTASQIGLELPDPETLDEVLRSTVGIKDWGPKLSSLEVDRVRRGRS